MIIQDEINALGPGGGTVYIPPGLYPGPALILKNGVTLRGETKGGTSIPPIAPSAVRLEGLGLHDVTIDGSYVPGAYGLDWRNVSASDLSNVIIKNAAYGLIMVGPAYYNTFVNLFVDVTHTAVELSGGANQNTFIGGRWTAPRGVTIYSTNGTTLIGTSLESSLPDMIFKTIVGDDGSTSARGVRMEDANHSSTYWNT